MNNAKLFPDISTYPHHYHNSEGDVIESPLTGDPEKDIYSVLNILDCLV